MIYCEVTVIDLPGAVALSVAFPLRGKKNPLPLIQEEQVVVYWLKNGHLILLNCLWEACPGTVWFKCNWLFTVNLKQ